MSRRFFIAVGMLLAAVASITFLWKQALLLSTVLIVLALVKRRFLPIAREFHWYAGLTIGGAIVEILMVNIGGAWSYVTPQVLNIPLWMPLFWGLVGTISIVLYTEITRKI